MRQVTGAGEVAAVAVNLHAVVVEDVVVEAREEPHLVFPERLPVVAVPIEGVRERDHPLQPVARGTAKQQQRLEIRVLLQLLKHGLHILQVVEVEAEVARVLDDGLVDAHREDAGEGAVVELVRLVLSAVPLVLDRAVFTGAVFGVVADDVVEHIDQVPHLVRVFVRDGAPEDAEAGQSLQVALRRRLHGVVVRCAPEIHRRGVAFVCVHGL